jgi:hypothetical protein
MCGSFRAAAKNGRTGVVIATMTAIVTVTVTVIVTVIVTQTVAEAGSYKGPIHASRA